MRRIQLGVAVFVAIVISACQTLPQVPYDRVAAGQPKSIAVLTPAARKEANVVLATSVGQSFGLIGALIDAGMQSNRETEFAKFAAPKNFSGPDSLVRYTSEALTSAGYSTSVGSVPRQDLNFLKVYPTSTEVPGDAFLDIKMQYGYLAAGISTPYRPFVFVECKLVKASDKSVLMQRTIAYNSLWPVPDQGVTLAPDPVYEFKDFDALIAEPDKAVEGLDKAIAQVAGTIGTLVR